MSPCEQDGVTWSVFVALFACFPAGESQPLQWFQPRLQECGKEQEEEVMAGLEEPSAGCGVRHAPVLLHSSRTSGHEG